MMDGFWHIFLLVIALLVFFLPVGILVFFCMLGFLTGAQKVVSTGTLNKVWIIGVSFLTSIVVTGSIFYLFYF